MRLASSLAFAVVALAGCAPPVSVGTPCNSDLDCAESMACRSGTCAVRPGGAIAPERDAGRLEVDAGDGPGASDGGASDVDAGAADAGRADAGDLDAGEGERDAGEGDLDAGALDAGGLDAGELDAGQLDAGLFDAGVVDAGPVLPADWWDPGWRARRLIRFQNAFQPETLVGFPVLIDLDASVIDLSRVAEGGRDLRFVDADTTTVLPHEIESWDPGGTSHVWVRVPRIDARSTVDHIWLYYDNPGAADAQDPAALWADHALVLHMRPDPTGTTGALDDATGNGHAASTNSAARASGISGEAVSLAPTGESIEVPTLSGASFPQSRGTVMLWVKGALGTQGEGDNLFDSWSDAREHLFLRAHGGGDLQMAAQLEGAAGYDVGVSHWGWSSASSWHLVGASFDVQAGRVQLFIDNDEYGPYPLTTWTPSGQEVAFGRGFEGLFDEARVATVARSQHWMRAEYLVGTRRFVILDPPRVPPPAAPRTAARVPGALALYDFDEGTGTTVRDTSGAGAPLDLELLGADKTQWIEGGLWIRGAAMAASAGPATKISEAIELSGAITVEAWVMPDNELLDGPARIVTLSSNSSVRNFTLGQDRQRYDFRLRTVSTNANGSSHSDLGVSSPKTPSGSVDVTAPTHVLFERWADGHTHAWVNGVEVTSTEWPGDLSVWDAAWRLALGNEFDDDGETVSPARPWMGAVYLVAIYDRALTDAEVQQNYAAGP